MNATLNTQSMPFRFLLYTEWVMLGSCGILAVIEAWQTQRIPVIHVLILLTLLVMGLALPKVKPSLAYFYTALQMGLILLGTTLGYLHILPTLYLIVMIRSCFLLQPPGRLIVAGLSFIFFAVHQVQYLTTIMPLWLPAMGEQRIWMHQIAEFLMFGLSLFLISRLVTTLIDERRTQEKLTQAHHQLRQYSLQIEELAAVQERNRIAREIHDSLGHALTSLNVQLQTGLKLWQRNPEEAHAFLEQAQQLGTIAMQEVRQSVSTLRADEQNETPLQETIATLLQEFRQSRGIPIQSSIHLTTPLSPEMSRILYRLTQEALTNICKHAEATEVRLELKTDPNQVYLAIADNGRGFSYPQITSGYGLQGMKERVAAMNGNFHLQTSPGQGCQITITLPLNN
ncbi:sensor histidine kinase [Leptothermofonsia sichuanensis E412]|uniref:sensor histidine kinase n=1 Tax=Leptothermofonsia sichuanensis TaxID=2917832 RepID=UPI001CA75415|nr:sensor histidine kinase [Leptothermofonsia sichuanensis]QZZ19914.1 sensor histidine kinase [Leptothermofonsia sichuanensis E412]